MPTSTPSTADDWERRAAQRIATAGVVAERGAILRAGRTLARLARTFDAEGTTCVAVTASSPAHAAHSPSTPARAGATAHAAFVAALASLARE